MLFLPFFTALCLPGYVSETGLSTDFEGCYPCPSGFFQEAAGQRGCLKCPSRDLSQSVMNLKPQQQQQQQQRLRGLSSILQCPEVEKARVNDEVSTVSKI